MTPPRAPEADKYIKMMWGIISLNITILLAILGITVSTWESNNRFATELEHLNSWTKEVHKWEIVPTKELSIENHNRIVEIKSRLHGIDSVNILQNGHILRLFRSARIDRDGVNALDD